MTRLCVTLTETYIEVVALERENNVRETCYMHIQHCSMTIFIEEKYTKNQVVDDMDQRHVDSWCHPVFPQIAQNSSLLKRYSFWKKKVSFK